MSKPSGSHIIHSPDLTNKWCPLLYIDNDFMGQFYSFKGDNQIFFNIQNDCYLTWWWMPNNSSIWIFFLMLWIYYMSWNTVHHKGSDEIGHDWLCGKCCQILYKSTITICAYIQSYDHFRYQHILCTCIFQEIWHVTTKTLWENSHFIVCKLHHM